MTTFLAVTAGALIGAMIWWVFFLPMQARWWDKARKQHGLSPQRPPGLVGRRSRKRYDDEGR